MRANAAEAERRQEVREAARGWERAGAIDAAKRAEIDAAYPDDRARLGPVFRVLVFGFTIVIASSCFGLFGLVLASLLERAGWLLLMFFGVVLAGATELQLGRLRRRQGGIEAATAFLAVAYLAGAMLWLQWLVLDKAQVGEAVSITVALILVAVLCAAAAYRWGYTLFAVLAAISGFVLLARFPFGRVLWIGAAVVLAPLLLRAGDSLRLPPVHRRSCQAVAAVALVFLYLAVHLGSWDGAVVEQVADWHALPNSDVLRPLFVAATALVPVLVMAWGIGTRSRLLINLSLVALLASIVTLRMYVHVAPAWIALVAGGAVSIVIALALRRYLDSGSGHERHGFTAEPLYTDPERRGVLEVAAGVVSLSPAARAEAKPGYEGGGGRSGGAGASGAF